MWKVYGLFDPQDERIRYVGCTTLKCLSSRLAAHVDQAKFPSRRGYKAARSAWVREVLEAGRRPCIVLLQTAFSEEEAAQVEQTWIERFGSQLTNQSDGGPGLPNPSDEVRSKLSKAQLRIWASLSPEERAKRDARLAAVARLSGPKARIAGHTPEANAKRSASLRAFHARRKGTQP